MAVSGRRLSSYEAEDPKQSLGQAGGSLEPKVPKVGKAIVGVRVSGA